MPAHVRRAFLSREGPLSIRDFFKLGITFAVVVYWISRFRATKKATLLGRPRLACGCR